MYIKGAHKDNDKDKELEDHDFPFQNADPELHFIRCEHLDHSLYITLQELQQITSPLRASNLFFLLVNCRSI